MQAVMPGSRAPVRDVKPLIESCQRVRVNNHQLHPKIEAVISGFRLVPPGVRDRPRRQVIDDGPENCPRGQEARRKSQQSKLCSEVTFPKLVDPGPPRDHGGERDQRHWQEGVHGQVGCAKELDAPVGFARLLVEREEALNGDGDDHDQDHSDADEEGPEQECDPFAPAEKRVISPNDPLRKDQIRDEQNQNPRGREYLTRDADVDVPRPRGPHYPHREGDYARHAEAEQQDRKQKLVASFPVALEYRHVGCRAQDEES